MRIMRLFPTHIEPELGELRGNRFFKLLEEGGDIQVSEMNEEGAIQLGAGVMFVDGGQLSTKPIVEEHRRRMGIRVRVIVDVHFPLTLPIEHLTAFQPGTNDKTRDLRKDQEAREYWSNPVNKQAALDMVEEADAVTCPNPWWARGLEKYNANVVVLPDIKDPRSGGEFAAGWARATALAVGKRPPSRLRLWVMKRGIRYVLNDEWDKEKGEWIK